MARPSSGTAPRAADLDLRACLACGQVCEVTGAFLLPAGSTQERYVRTRCVVGHLIVGPEFALQAPAGAR